MTQSPKSLTAEWIGKAPLDKICIVLVETHLESQSKPDGAVLAHLVKRLIAAETSPGGPYRNTHGNVDLPTNTAIGYLFAFLHTPLPNVTAYIEDHRHKSTSREVRKLLKKYDMLACPKVPSYLSEPYEHIFQAVHVQLEQLEDPLKTLSLEFLARLKKADKNHEIALFPRFFHQSLLAPNADIPLDTLGEANIYCWVAYTIYDHLLDGQPITKYLPVANIAMRLALARYQSLFPPAHPFQAKIMDTFADMDAANSWELLHCRFDQQGDSITISSLPSYGQLSLLARRSFGHALGPLAVAHLSGQSGIQLKSIEKGLRQYLIARQLGDDIHDWQEDIREGSSSTVVTSILRHARITPGTYEIDSLVQHMKEDFWQHSMKVANDLMSHHVRLSREYFLKSNGFSLDSPLFSLLTRLETIAHQSVEEQTRYKSFAAAYRQLSVE